MEIYNLMCELRDIKEGDQAGVYDVEIEIIETGKLHAKFFNKRYSSEAGGHWMGDRSVFVGLVGQKVFDVVLQQYGILSDFNDPTIDWRRKKNYDFKTNLGTIETKCFDHYCQKVLIKTSEWHSNDFRIMDFPDPLPPSRITGLGEISAS